MSYGKKWDVIVKHKIFICKSDRENIYKCPDNKEDVNQYFDTGIRFF